LLTRKYRENLRNAAFLRPFTLSCCSLTTRPGRSTPWLPPLPNPYLPLDLPGWDAELWPIEWLDPSKPAPLLDAQIAQPQPPTVA
jgi:hypothetical protein